MSAIPRMQKKNSADCRACYAAVSPVILYFAFNASFP